MYLFKSYHIMAVLRFYISNLQGERGVTTILLVEAFRCIYFHFLEALEVMLIRRVFLLQSDIGRQASLSARLLYIGRTLHCQDIVLGLMSMALKIIAWKFVWEEGEVTRSIWCFMDSYRCSVFYHFLMHKKQLFSAVPTCASVHFFNTSSPSSSKSPSMCTHIPPTHRFYHAFHWSDCYMHY